MLIEEELRRIAKARLDDAQALLDARRYDSANYLCGYAVELALKARICNTLSWEGYPSTSAEFKNYQTFKTHDFDVLLHLTGLEREIKTDERIMRAWSVVGEWNPEVRYQPIGTATKEATRLMVDAAKKLLEKL